MPEEFDIVIENGLIVRWFRKTGVSRQCGHSRRKRLPLLEHFEADGTKVIDAQGKVVSPGFIDPHSHADVTLLKYPLAENLVMQGITTVIAGNCGMSLAPFPEGASSDILTALKNALGGDMEIPGTHSVSGWIASNPVKCL